MIPGRLFFFPLTVILIATSQCNKGSAMIEKTDNVFTLSTHSTTYLFRVNETGHLEHLYYGPRLSLTEGDLDAIREKRHLGIGTGVAYDNDHDTLFLENLCMEYSTEGKGDYRIPMVSIAYGNGKRTLDFVYQEQDGEIIKGKPVIAGIGAQSYGAPEECQTLSVHLKDRVLDVALTLTYTTFDACDVIARSATVTNHTDKLMVVHNLASLQLDLFDDRWNLTTFHGAWAREREKDTRPIFPGTMVNESRSGVSSAEHNPLVFLSRPEATENFGNVIGCNLVYSGNHRESVEVSPFGKTRLLSGINPDLFSWKLEDGKSFTSPEAVLTFSAAGFSQASAQFHAFVNNHILRGVWKFRERPVLLNSWEASYFHFTEDSLFKLAKQASSLGVELFVLDDGWFGSRDDDTTSLGDWHVNLNKFPSGLSTLAQKIHNLGMMFGLWVEPEMVNKDSQLYREHPDWMIAINGREPSVGRHQYLLDLTRKEVREYLFDTISDVFQQCDVNYVKWDMNRVFSDIDSRNKEIANLGEYSHRYVLSLYRLLDRFTKAFPNVLFEGCASGGNRFDLGMLCYCSQIWVSDNTDAYSRLSIQEGTSYGYPPSTMGCHVSQCPNHQTLRVTPLASRFNVACFGSLGYELDVTTLSHEEKQEIAEEIAFYRQFRAIFQFGSFSRIRHDDIIQWICASPDRNTLLVLWFQSLNPANTGNDLLLVPQAKEGVIYDVFPRQQRIPLSVFGSLIKRSGIPGSQNETVRNLAADNVSLPGEIEHYTVSGSVLKYAGIKLNQQFSGTGFDGETRVLGDFGSRLYVIKKH